ncbi:hypothetical protein MRX96_040479 [Rhipicephalus microplus]
MRAARITARGRDERRDSDESSLELGGRCTIGERSERYTGAQPNDGAFRGERSSVIGRRRWQRKEETSGCVMARETLDRSRGPSGFPCLLIPGIRQYLGLCPGAACGGFDR